MTTKARNCGCNCAAHHPIDVLMQEHTTILAVLAAAEREIERADARAPVRESFWRDYLSFLDNYADHCHHAKEEDVLFAELEQAGMLRNFGPTRCMRDEHETMRRGRNRVRELLTGDDAAALHGAVRAGIAMLRAHIGKENEVLFPLARGMLDDEAVDRVRRGFARIEHAEMGDGAHERFEQLAATLCADEPSRASGPLVLP